MTRIKLCWMLAGAWLVLGVASVAQTTTTVSDTVYRADGSAAQGSLLISWPQFMTVSGTSVAAGNTTVTLGSGGALSVDLEPNAGSDPIGSYYTVIYHLDDGSVARENWVVPVSGSAVHLAAVRSTVMPLSVAMQTASKNYVDHAIASALAAKLTSTTDLLKGDGTGSAVDSGVAASNVAILNASNTYTTSGVNAYGSATEKFAIYGGTATAIAWNRNIATGTLYDSGHAAYQLQHNGSATACSDSFGWTVYGGSGVVGTPLRLFGDGSISFGGPCAGLGVVGFGSSNQATIDGSGNIATSGRIAPQTATPGSSSVACVAGQMWTDASYIYVCTAANTIKRAALSSF